jgi:hypothetical protein
LSVLKMTLENWGENRWLQRHETQPEEIASLLEIVDRDLEDASFSELSLDWQFGIAYNAALKLCTILLYGEGYRATGSSAHYRTIQAVSKILGEERKEEVYYLDACRKKRNIVKYDFAGAVTESDVRELLEFTREFRSEVVSWLQKIHPELLQ